jgi:hypothetical protein
MAIYILFMCCKCNNKRRLHLYSCSSNQYDISEQLCEHFNIKYSYTCKWGFFTLGWKIILDVKVQCRKCNHNYYNFGSNTFNADYYEFDTHHTCCYNVFTFNVSGYDYANDAKGLLLQQKQKELEESFKKEQQMKIEQEIKRQQEIKRKEEIKSQQEIKRKEEIKIKEEIKRKEEKIQKEKIKINKIMETQKKEEKEIKQLFKCDTNYIDTELSHLLNNIDFKINSELSSDISEKLNEKIDITISKYDFC